MLEMVDQAAVRQEGKGFADMRIQVFVLIFFEEVFHPRMGKEFHRHGVDLAAFIRREREVRRIDMFAGLIHLESVTGFMRQHVNVAAGAVEIREDERNAVVIDAGAVAAHLLVRLGLKIEKIHFTHLREEFIRLRRHLMVHLCGSGDEFVTVPLRQRVSVREDQALVIAGQFRQSQTLCLAFIEFFIQRYDLFEYHLTISCNVIFVVVEAVHPFVAQFGKTRVTQFVCDPGADFDQTVVDIVEFPFVLGIEPVDSRIGAATDVTVYRTEFRAERGQIMDLAVEFDPGGSL